MNLARAYLAAQRRDDAMRELWVALELPAKADLQDEIRGELKRAEAGG